jgi:hypothetical protein
VNDDQRIERLLRARPAGDAAYQPVLVDLLETQPDEQRVVGSLRWRGGGVDLAGPLGLARPMALILLGAAVLLAAVAMLVGAKRNNELAVVQPSPAIAAPERGPIFPAAGISGVLERFQESQWSGVHNVTIEAAVAGDERIWFTGSAPSVFTYPVTGESYPGTAVVRVGGGAHLKFTAMALWLVGQGRLDLDVPMNRYVSSWPGGEAITIRNLLDASSGVASFGEPIEDLARDVAAEPSRTWTAADALRRARDRSPRFQPGAGHEAVDTEDALLVEIIEAVTGSPVQNAFCGPETEPTPSCLYFFHMPLFDSRFPTVGGLWDADRSGTLLEVADLPEDVVAVLGPARDWAIPVRDLAQVTHAIHTQFPLRSGVTAAMLDESFEDGGFGGSAMCPCSDDARTGVGLIGHMGPYTSLVVYVPSERLTFAIVANVAISDDDLEGLLQEIHDLVWPGSR